MPYTLGPFTLEDVGFIQIASTKILAAVSRDELDLNHLAREELVRRGCDKDGFWVGSLDAREIHNI